MHDDFYQMYLEEMKELAPCGQEEQRELLIAAGKGDEAARKRLIEGNLHAALEYAREFEGQGVPLIDLVQEANMALLEALEEYLKVNPEADFDTYMGSWVRKALHRALEEEKASDRTGKELAARINVLQKVAGAMARDLGREPDLEELADKVKMSQEEVRRIMKMAMDAISVNAAGTGFEAEAGLEGLKGDWQ